MIELVVVALSGGKDSTCVLHKTIQECKNNQKKKLFGAIIINHNMRLESNREAQAIQRYWSKKGVKVAIIHHQDGNLKNQKDARFFRLNQLSIFAIQHGISTIILGHNLEDKIETYLLRKERASTFFGLASMSSITHINGIKFIRPLLYTSRVYIDQYIKDHDLFFIEDGSNATDKYERNRIRHHITPAIHIGRTLEIIRENVLKRRFFHRKIQTWSQLHLIQIDNFTYKFIWNRLPSDTILASLILSHIVHKVRGKASNWAHVQEHMTKKNFHISNVNFIKRGDYCYVEESLSDQETHSGSWLLFNYKLLLVSLNDLPVTIKNVKWPLVEINGELYDFRHLPSEIHRETFYCRIIRQNYEVLYEEDNLTNKN